MDFLRSKYRQDEPPKTPRRWGRVILLAVVAFSFAYVAYHLRDIGDLINLPKIAIIHKKPTAGAQYTRSDDRWLKIEHKVVGGETFSSIINKYGIDTAQGASLMAELHKIMNLKSCQIDDSMVFLVDRDGNLQKFRYDANVANIYVAKKDEDGNFVAKKLDIPIETKRERMEASLKSSLYETFINAGEDPVLVEGLVDIFAWDIDFMSDPREGDKISLLVDKIYADGKFYKYGRIWAANYNGKEAKQIAIYFEPESGGGAYFDEKGNSLERNFLKTPVKFTRISSGYGMRRHPVTHNLKGHMGTDYAAPTGSPVWAMAGGTIIARTYHRANGNYIAIRHRNGYESYYLHLSKFQSGLRVGSNVSQKQLIGYVGSTGMSTGPHLHLGLKYNGRFINPLSIKKVKEITLAGKDLENFKTIVPEMITMLNGNTVAESF